MVDRHTPKRIWLRKLRSLKNLSWQRKAMWLEAFIRLGLSRFLVLTVPFKRIAPYLCGSPANISDHLPNEDLTPQTLETIQQVRWAIHHAAKNTPWNSNCLAKAIAAKQMLQQHNVSTMLHLGVRKTAIASVDTTKNQPAAHAWLCCKDTFITGKKGHLDYTVVATFN